MNRRGFLMGMGLLLLVAIFTWGAGPGWAQPAEGKSASPATQPKGTEEEKTPAQAAKNYTLEERQAYQQKVAADLAKMEQGIDDLYGKYEKARLRRTALKGFAGLRKQLIATQNQLAALKKAPEKDWSAQRADMDQAMEKLTDAYQEAESSLQ